VQDDIVKINKAKCDASFKAQERDRAGRIYAHGFVTNGVSSFASKSNSPNPTKYRARFSQVENPLSRNVTYIPTPENFGFIRKQQLNLSNMTICPHTIRVIEDWAGAKVKTTKSTFGSTGFGNFS